MHVPVDHVLKRAGYVTARAVGCAEVLNCSVIRNRKGGRPTLVFPDEGCVLLDWHSVVERGRRTRA